MARINQEHILRLLLQAPLTCEWLLHASASFPKPYRTLGRVREVMAQLIEQGLVRRCPLLELHQGQRRWLYFLDPRARILLPELADLSSRSGVFHPPQDPRAHGLAVAEVVAHLHRSLGEAAGRARLLESLRDRALHLRVELEQGSVHQRQVAPDQTFLVELDAQPQLLLLELQNRGAVILPVSPRSVARSFQFKLAKHKAALATFRDHPTIARMIAVHGPLTGFRTLVVTTRSRQHLRHLLASATRYAKLFYFTTLEQIRQGNLLLDPLWELPNGTRRSIADP